MSSFRKPQQGAAGTETAVEAARRRYEELAAEQDAAADAADAPGGDDEGFQVTEPVEIDSLADQESNVLPAASKVLFIIKKAELRTQLIDNKLAEGDRLDTMSLDVNKWTAHQLHLELKIKNGIDVNGTCKNRIAFCDFYIAINKANDLQALREAHARKNEQKRIKGQQGKPFNKEWWLNESRYTAKLFYAALGFDVANPPVCNDDFLIGLMGAEIVADIFRVPDDFRGGFKNEVKNFRSVENG